MPKTSAYQYLDAGEFDQRSTRTMNQTTVNRSEFAPIPEAERTMRIEGQGRGLGDLYDPRYDNTNAAS